MWQVLSFGVEAFRGERQRRNIVMDILYLGLALGFFALSWALVVLCERL